MASKMYDVEEEIAIFFTKTSVSRPECDAFAEKLVGGKATIVVVQGTCSYTVYAGPSLEYVVQFRLQSLKLDLDKLALARQVYGAYAPSVTFKGCLGEESKEKEPLWIYVMTRINGVTHLDFILAHGFAHNSPENFPYRRTLMIDLARFFAISWKAPQPVDESYRNELMKTFGTELRMLLKALPARLQPSIQKCIDGLNAIFTLPMVLLHEDFGFANVLVDDETCHLTGVLDWAESRIGPFGLNLDCLLRFTGHFHLRKGWERFDDYDSLYEVFWKTLSDEVGGLTDDCIATIRLALLTGLLLHKGFTGRLANDPEPVPIGEDERGRYNMLWLDGILVNPATRIKAAA